MQASWQASSTLRGESGLYFPLTAGQNAIITSLQLGSCFSVQLKCKKGMKMDCQTIISRDCLFLFVFVIQVYVWYKITSSSRSVLCLCTIQNQCQNFTFRYNIHIKVAHNTTIHSNIVKNNCESVLFYDVMNSSFRNIPTLIS